MARWVGTQGQVTSAKEVRKHVSIVMSPQETPNPKKKNLNSNWKTSRIRKDLNSSLDLSVGKLWLDKVITFNPKANVDASIKCIFNATS